MQFRAYFSMLPLVTVYSILTFMAVDWYINYIHKYIQHFSNAAVHDATVYDQTSGQTIFLLLNRFAHMTPKTLECIFLTNNFQHYSHFI